MWRLALALAVTAASTALAACGSGTKTITTTVSGGSTPVTQTSPSTTSSGGGNAAHSVGVSSFQSPSANIGCMIAAGTARCDIKDRSWSPPARPSSCPSEVDFGQGVTVGGSGSGRLVCAGDTAINPGAPKLAYGTAPHVADFTCTSQTTGVTCRNDTTGHGFTLSRESYRVF